VTAGLLVGALVGLTGVGGGSMMTPILVLLFGQSPAVAVGTDLLFSASTKIAATLSFGYSRKIDWPVVRRLAFGSIPGAILVLVWFWTMRAGPPAAVNHIILRCLAIMLIVTAVVMLFQYLAHRLQLKRTVDAVDRGERSKGAATVLVGLVLGVAVTLTSVGAGALGTVALLYLYPRRLAGSRLVGTDIAHALPLTIVAGLGHSVLGHVNLPVLGYLLLGSVPGVLIASRAAIRLPQAFTRALIGIMLAVVGVRILLG
jgi:uncharacterized membrane protein YfcA